MPVHALSTSQTTATLRRLVLFIFLLGVVGSGVELVLLEHTEQVWQVLPVAALGLAVLVALWAGLRPARGSLRALQLLMGLFVVLGGIGLYLHYRGNAEFELEMYPSMKGFELIWKTMTGATPVLGPGVMIQLGLLGFAYTYRHPALAAPTQPSTPPEGT